MSRTVIHVWLLAVYLLAVSVNAQDDPPHFYMFGLNVRDRVLPVNDDGLSSAMYIETGFPFLTHRPNRSVVFVSTAQFICRALLLIANNRTAL